MAKKKKSTTASRYAKFVADREEEERISDTHRRFTNFIYSDDFDNYKIQNKAGTPITTDEPYRRKNTGATKTTVTAEDYKASRAHGGKGGKFTVETTPGSLTQSEFKKRTASGGTVTYNGKKYSDYNEYSRATKKDYEDELNKVIDAESRAKSENKSNLLNKILNVDSQNIENNEYRDLAEQYRQKHNISKEEFDKRIAKQKDKNERDQKLERNIKTSHYQAQYAKLDDNDKAMLDEYNDMSGLPYATDREYTYEGSTRQAVDRRRKAIETHFAEKGYDSDALTNFSDYRRREKNAQETQELKNATQSAVDWAVENGHPGLATVMTSPVTAAAADVMSWGTAIPDAIDNAVRRRRVEATGAQYLGADVNSPYQQFRNTGEVYKEDALKDASNTYKQVYNTAESILTSLATRYIGSSVSGALGAAGMSAGAAMTAGAAVGGSMLGIQAYNDTLMELEIQGIDERRAQATAIASGINEMLWESLSIELFPVFQEMPLGDLVRSRAFKDFIKVAATNVAKGAVVNASEEFMTEVGNIVAESLILGADSDYQKARQKYEMSGDSHPSLSATREMLATRGLEAAKGGAIQGLVMGAASNAYGIGQKSSYDTYRANEAGREIAAKGQASEYIEAARQAGGDTQAYLEKLSKKRGGESNLTSKDVGKIALKTSFAEDMDIETAQRVANVHQEAREKRKGTKTEEDYIDAIRDSRAHYELTNSYITVNGERTRINANNTEETSKVDNDGRFVAAKVLTGSKGNLAFNTGDGRRVKLSESAINSIENETTKALVRAAVDNNLDSNAANLLIDTYDGTESAQEHADAFMRIYRQAELGTSLHAVFGMTGNTETDRASFTESQLNAIDQAAKANKEFKAGLTRFSTQKKGKFAEIQENLIDRIAKAFGKEVVLVDNLFSKYVDANGREMYRFYNGEALTGENRIILSSNAQKGLLLSYLGHEMGHMMKAQDSAAFNKFADIVKTQYGDTWDEQKAKFKKLGYGDELVEEELVANAFFDVFTKQDNLKEIFGTKDALALKAFNMLEKISREYDKAMQKYAGAIDSQGNLKHSDIAKLRSDKAALDGAVNAMREYYNNLKNGATSDTSERFSISDEEYTDAIKEYGEDSREVANIVEQAAKDAGYNTKVYHGTKSKFNTFKLPVDELGIHFGTKSQARTFAGYSKDAIMQEDYIKLSNPIRFDEDLGSWYPLEIVKKLLSMDIMNMDDARAVMATSEGHKRSDSSAIIDLRKWLTANGYDGIVYPNYHEGKTVKDSYLIWDKSAVKSANPVTYDRDGNIIPLSERFNKNNEDIRYSVSDEEEAKEFSDADTRYSIRDDDPPQKTIIAYKAFIVKNGKLYPPMVANPEGAGTPVGVWLNADTGELARDKDGNLIYAKTTGRIKVKSTKGGPLAWRPGWHLGEWPDARQFAVKNPETGELDVMPENIVFAKCEIAADKDYQLEAFSYGVSKKGKFNRTQAGLPYIPRDGFYKYRTNPNPETAPWYITGAMKVVEILDDKMSRDICAQFGVTPMPRRGGDINLESFGLKAGAVVPTADLSAVPKGVDLSDEVRNLPGYVQRELDFSDPTFRNEFAIDGYNEKQIAEYEKQYNSKADVETKQLNDAGIGIDKNAKSAYSVNYTLDKTDFDRNLIIDNLVAQTGRSKADAERWLDAENSLAAIILAHPEYLEYEGDERYKAIKEDSDYPQGTIDLSNLCIKREEFTTMFDKLQKMYPNKVFTAKDAAKMRQILSKAGITVACGFCYVEDRRQHAGEAAQDFIDQWKESLKNGTPLLKSNHKNNLKVTKDEAKKYGLKEGALIYAKDEYVPNQYDIVTYEGFKKLTEEHPKIARAFENYNNARGQAKIRQVEGRAEYDRQILKWTPAQIKKANEHGGLRIFSFSDFEAVHLLDLAQAITDAASKGVMIQGYTKRPEFARLVRNTGIKLNRSLIPKGATGLEYKNGKAYLTYDTTEGIDINDPNFLDERDNPNVGNIIIGISDEQIGVAMLDDFIDYIIPYHTNKSSAITKELGVGEWTNYKLTQTEKSLKDGSSVKDVNIYTDVLNNPAYNITNKYEFVNAFLEECKKQGKKPRFAQFLNVDENGDYSYREGYHKLIIDFKLFGQEGNILPQGKITPDFDNEFMKEILLGEVKKKSEYKFPQKVFNQLVKEFGDNGSKYSVNDEEYAPTFYSQMGKVVDGINQGKLSTNGLVNMLKGKGVKDEEIKWSGIEEWLAEKGKSVTKEELQEFVKNSMLNIETVTLDARADFKVNREGDETFTVLAPDGERIGFYYDEEAGTFLSPDVDLEFETPEDAEMYFNDPYVQMDNDIDVTYKTKWHQYKTEGGSNYREMLFTVPGSGYSNQAMDVHWGRPGVLAHARIQDMPDSDGNKMLFIDEIQSDWHNLAGKTVDGKAVGYAKKGARTKQEITQAIVKVDKDFKSDDGAKSIIDKIGNRYGRIETTLSWLLDTEVSDTIVDQLSNNSETTLTNEERALVKKYVEKKKKLEDEWQKAPGPYTPPDAPFKNGKYVDYVLKNLLRMAAEKGYDKLAWTPSEMQSERWSDEFAEGYRIEYDQDIPKFLNKFGKKFGAKVGISYINKPNAKELQSHQEDIDNLTSVAEMRKAAHGETDTGYLSIMDIIKNTIQKMKGTPVWSIDITPEMRDSVLYEGQPMYSISDEEYFSALDKYGEDSREVSDIVKKYAENRGYKSLRLFHGTDGWKAPFGFTKVDFNFSDDGQTFFMTDSVEGAATYSGTDKVRKISDTTEKLDKKADQSFLDYMDAAYDLARIINEGEAESEWEYALGEEDIKGALDYVGGRYDDAYIDKYQIVPEAVKELQRRINEVYEDDVAQSYADEIKNAAKVYAKYVEDTTDVDRGNQGIYQLYADTSNFFEYDAQGSYWNELKFEADGEQYPMTRDLAKYALDNGYKGLIIHNVRDNGNYGNTPPIDVYVAFSAEQVKSADPVTYDDNGKVIPLSERFNEANEDIRYSVSDEEDTMYSISHDISAEELEGNNFLDNASPEEIRKIVDAVDRKMRERPYFENRAEQQEIFGILDELRRAKDEILQVASGKENQEVAELSGNEELIGTRYGSERNLGEATVTNKGQHQNISKETTDKLVKKYKKEYSLYRLPLSDENNAIASKKLQDFYEELQNNKEMAWEDAYEKARDIAIEIVKYTKFYEDVYYHRGRPTERRMRVRYDNNYGRLITSRDDPTMTEADRFEVDWEEGLAPLVNEILTDFFDVPISNAAAVKNANVVTNYKNQITALKRQIKDLQKTANASTRDAVKQQKLADDIYYQKRIKEIRDDRDQKLIAQKLAYQESKAKTRETKLRKEWSGKILRTFEKMDTELRKPNANRYVPENLVRTVAGVLSGLSDTLQTTDYYTSGKREGQTIKSREAQNKKLADLKVAYDALEKDERYPNTYNEVVSQMLQVVNENVKDKTIEEMNSDELKQVSTALTAIEHTIRNAAKVEIKGREADAFKVADRNIEQSKDVKKKKINLITKYWYEQLNPRSFFRQMSGYTDGGWMDVYNILNDGQLKQSTIKAEVTEAFRELTSDKSASTLMDTKNLVDVGLKDAQGNSIPITRGMMISLYMHLLNEDNMRHIERGGLTIPDLEKYYKNDKEAYGNTLARSAGASAELIYLNRQIKDLNERLKIREATGGNTMELENEIADKQARYDKVLADADALSESIRLNIEKQLTAYDRKWIKQAQWLFDEYSKGKLNEATMKMYGFRKANVQNYMPIRTDETDRAPTFEGVTRDVSLENAGFMKDRLKGASNAIYLEDIVDVIQRQMNNVATYAGLAPAINDFTKIYGKSKVSEEGDAVVKTSVQGAVRDTFGKYGLKYIHDLVTDLQGGRRREPSFISTLRGNAYQAALTLNLRVAMAQAGSYPTAAAEIGWKPLMKALARGGEKGMPISKADRELIAKYTPLLENRVNGGNSTVDINNLKTLSSKSLNGLNAKILHATAPLTDWISKVDAATVGRLWYAAQYYVDDNSNLSKGTDEYYQEVAKVFNRIVERTQPSYTTMQRSALLRNPNEAQKLFTMYMTQRAQNYNLLYDSAMELNAVRQRAKNGTATEEELKKSRENFGRTVSSQLAAGITLSAMKILADAIQHSMKGYRDDDDDEVKAKNILEKLGTTFLESEASNIFLGSEIYSLASSLITKETYYGISVNVAGTLTDLTKDLSQLINNPSEQKLVKTMKDAGMILGIPTSQLQKFVNMGKYWYQDIVDGGGIYSNYEGEESTKQITGKMIRAYLDGDTKKYNTISEALKGTSDTSVKSAITNWVTDKYLADEIDYNTARRIFLNVYKKSAKETDKKMKELDQQKSGTETKKETKMWGG